MHRPLREEDSSLPDLQCAGVRTYGPPGVRILAASASVAASKSVAATAAEQEEDPDPAAASAVVSTAAATLRNVICLIASAMAC